jgi:hypothetical protein
MNHTFDFVFWLAGLIACVACVVFGSIAVTMPNPDQHSVGVFLFFIGVVGILSAGATIA